MVAVRLLTRFVTQIVVNAIALLAAASWSQALSSAADPPIFCLLGIIFGLVNGLVKPAGEAADAADHVATLGLVQPGGHGADVLSDRAVIAVVQDRRPDPGHLAP